MNNTLVQSSESDSGEIRCIGYQLLLTAIFKLLAIAYKHQDL